jgi:peptidoglycan hydrolase-like protein with peptidoglycan-binding domain
MKKIIQSSRSMGTFGVLALLSSFVFITQAYAYNTIDASIDLGDSNSNVTNLQTFFKDNSTIYPEGLVTGYFGSLSRSAVQRFQSQNGIITGGTAETTGYGRVGPATRSAINSLINSGGWSGSVSTSDVSGPSLFNVSRSQGANSATFSFNTNENTIARVVYNTSPVMFNEGDINSNGFGALGGYSASSYNNMTTYHSVAIGNLQPNTLYYYTVIATDASGNISVVGPNNTFRTSAQ